MELVNQPTSKTVRKVQYASAGAGASAAVLAPASLIISTIVTKRWFPELEGLEMHVSAVFTGVVTWGTTWFVGYMTRERA